LFMTSRHVRKKKKKVKDLSDRQIRFHLKSTKKTRGGHFVWLRPESQENNIKKRKPERKSQKNKEEAGGIQC